MVKVLTVFSAIRDEEFYIEMAIRSVVERSFGVYLQDTGSKDKTVSIVKNLQLEYPKKIVLEEKYFGGKYRFDFGPWAVGQPPTGFDEAKARAHGSQRAIEAFPDYDWILSIDADEIVSDKMFSEVDRASGLGAFQLGHATLCPMTPYTISNRPEDFKTISNTLHNVSHRLFDPHIRAWSKKLSVVFGYGSGGYHIWQNVSDVGRLVSDEQIHFHLHYGFGPKSVHGWLCQWTDTAKGFAKSVGIPEEFCEEQRSYEERFPDWFVGGRFKPKSEVLKSVLDKSILLKDSLPKFVVDKWKEWGDYET